MSDENFHKRSVIYLPDELIPEILKSLPAKSLLRCLSVCKSWYTLIKSPNFISAHLDHQITRTNSNVGPTYLLYNHIRVTDPRVFVHRDNAGLDRELEFNFMREFDHGWSFPLSNIDSCHGVVCFACLDRHVALWNPSARKSVELVVPRGPDVYASFSYGFGYDGSVGQYKLVAVVPSTVEIGEPENVTIMTRVDRFYVYSVSEGAWRCCSSASFELRGECRIEYNGVQLDGVIHWLVDRTYDGFEGFEDFEGLDSVLMFGLRDETFSEILLPRIVADVAYNNCDEVKLMVVKGSVGVLHAGEAFIHLWVLEEKERKEPWRKVISLNLNYHRVVNMRMNGDFVLEVDEGRSMVSLDPRTLERTQIRCDERMRYLGTYIESLVLLGEREEVTDNRECDSAEDK